VINLFSITGDLILKTQKLISAGAGNTIRIGDTDRLAPGMYILKISSGSIAEYLYMIKIEDDTY
jgi:hypothetical protein